MLIMLKILVGALLCSSAQRVFGDMDMFSLEQEYETLGVTSMDSTESIKKAHRKMSIEYHPDKNPGCSDCTTRLALINAAYDKIIYHRKEAENPELSMFFGFSEKLFNIIKEVVDLWKHIPLEEKDRCWKLFESYKASDTFEKDLNHAGTLFSTWIVQILESNANEIGVFFGVVVTYNILAILGICWLVFTVFRIAHFILRLLLTPVWYLGSLVGLWAKKNGNSVGITGVVLTGTKRSSPTQTPDRVKKTE